MLKLIDEECPVDIEEMAQENDAAKGKTVLNRPGKREAFIVYYKLNTNRMSRRCSSLFRADRKDEPDRDPAEEKGKNSGEAAFFACDEP